MKVVGEIVNCTMYTHPLQDGDGNHIYLVEYYDKDGNTVKTEYFKNRLAASVAMCNWFDSKNI